MIAAPPSEAGALNATDALPLPGVAVAPVGAPGGENGEIGVTAFDAAEGALSPTVLCAVTVNV